MRAIYIFGLILILSGMIACKSDTGIQSQVQIIPRSDWGSRDTSISLPEQRISRITIHHGGVLFTGEKETGQYLRELQSWSRSEKKWIDIPYHYVMDLEGRVFEARPVKYAGDTNTDYDPTGHLLICVLGNYEEQKISNNQLEKLTSLLAYFSKLYQIDPDLIKGHKDFADTACPGRDLYRLIADGSLQSSVRKKNQITN